MSPFAGPVDDYVSGRAGSVTAALYDLKTGETFLLNPRVAPQATASIVKVDILETLLHQESMSGQTLSNAEIEQLTAMIEVSSNEAATATWYQAGGTTGIGAFNRLVGLADTTMSTCVQCGNFPWPGWGLTTTTPYDQLQLLKQLALPSRLLTVADQRFAQHLMDNIIPSLQWGVSDGPPVGSSVAMKTGDLPLTATDWQVNSLGWVRGGGHDFLMAMLSTGDPSLQYGIDTLNEISALMWEHWTSGGSS